MYYIFSFRSRNQSIGFFEAAVEAGISAKIISTPRVISIGCGLSVKVCVRDISKAERLLSLSGYNTFLGIFYYNGSEVKRIEKSN